MVQEHKIGIRFGCSEEVSQNFWSQLVHLLQNKEISTALIDLSGEDLLYNAISCMQAENRHEVYHTAPRVNAEKCKFCGKCIDYCKHKVISMQKGSGKIIIEPELCTDCGKCYKGCSKKGAIKKHDYLVGLVEWTDRSENLRVFRVAFRKKLLLRKKGIPLLKKLSKEFSCKIYGINTDYCGQSIEQEMDEMFDISDEKYLKTTIDQITNHFIH